MPRRLTLAAISVAAAVLTGAVLVASAATTPLRRDVAPRDCKPGWHAVAGPRVRQGTLQAVAARSERDAWAVGGIVRIGGITGGEVVSGRPLVERWDGRRWSVVESPGISGVLTDVALTSSGDAWAVGFVPRSESPIALHWNGRRWSAVALPAGVGSARAVSALSARNVWVLGRGTILRWDGHAWVRTLSLPDADLSGIDAMSPNNVWVVGATPGNDLGKALVLHWDGKRWQRYVRGPTAGSDDAWLLTVGGRSEDDVWAGGGEHLEELSPPAIGPLMLHWDGRRLSHVTLPGSGESEFVGIDSTRGNDVFAVSSDSWSYEEQGGDFNFAAWHGVGSRWTISKLPRGWELYDVATVPAGRGAPPVAWAVGQLGTRIVDYATRTVPLIMRFGC